jgi:hypothetical protein
MTHKQQILTEAILFGKSIKEAAKLARLNYSYARRIVAKGNIKSELDVRRAQLENKMQEQTEITRAHLVQEYGENLRRARRECQLAAANSAVAGQAKLLGYDAPQQGDGGDIGTVNIIVFGQSDRRKQIESRVVDNQ